MAGDVASSVVARRVTGAIQRFGGVSAIAYAVVLGIVPVQASAQAEPPSAPIAIIGSSVILDTEIDKIAAARPGACADLPPDVGSSVFRHRGSYL